jgi:purine-binding chemotaxis protein CheW
MTQYSTFFVGNRRFGLPILSVREIIRSCETTPVPLAPRHVRGLINLRGQIVTILDLAVRLGIPDREAAPEANVVVLEAGQGAAQAHERSADKGAGEDMTGLLVDSIGDVVEADLARMEPAPANVTDTDDQCIQGVIKTDTGLLVLLNLEPILGVRA